MDDKASVNFPVPSDWPVTPVWVAISIGTMLVLFSVFIASRIDPLRGTLMISLWVVIGFFAALGWAIRFNIPQDPETAALVGGLVASFGAVIAFWLGGQHR